MVLLTRQSDALVEAFLKAKNENQQCYILAHPEKALDRDLQDQEQNVYDARLSSYGNDVMQSMVYVQHGLQILLARLDDHRLGMFNETERVIITPIVRKVSAYAEKLTGVIKDLQTHKTKQQDER